MIKWFCRWVLAGEMMSEYLRGWAAGVNQQKFEPNTASHGWKSYLEYYGEEE